MTPIPAELDLDRKTSGESLNHDEAKNLRLAAEKLARACQEKTTQVKHRNTLHLPLNWINDETKITVQPYFHLRVPTDLLVQVGNHPFVSKEEQQFITDFFGLEVAIDRQAGVLSLNYDATIMKIYIGDTRYFSPLSPFSLLMGGLFALPDKKTFLRASKNGVAVGSFEKADETVIAVPGKVMNECWAEPIPWLLTFQNDYFYPVTLHKNCYVRYKNTALNHRTEIFTAPSLLFHHDSGFFHDFKPVALQTNTNQPKLKK